MYYRLLVRHTQLSLVVYTGAKEIDIAATLEHIRDQRINMVRSKVRNIQML